MTKKGLVLLTALVSLSSYWGCSKFKPGKFVMPSWDTQFSAPIFDRTYTLAEILYKDSVTTAGGDTSEIRTYPFSDLYYVKRVQALTGVPIGADLQIAAVPPTSVASNPLNFQIDTPDSIKYAVTPNVFPAGTNVDSVPSLPVATFNQGPAQPFTNFTTATIDTGHMVIVIHNGYPATMVFNSGQINLLDASGNSFPIPIDSVAANHTYDTTLNIAGRTMTNSPTVTFTYSSPGLKAPATFQSDTLLGIFVGFEDLHVDSAVAIVPPQKPFTATNSIIFLDANKVDSADVESGSITLSVSSQFPIPDSVELLFPGIVSIGSSRIPLTVDFVLQPGEQNHQEQISLAGYRLVMADRSGKPTNTINFNVTARSPGSSGQSVLISNSQTIQTSFSMSALSLSTFTGEMHLPGALIIANDTEKIDLGAFKSHFSGAVTFLGDSTKLDLNISSVGVPYLIHISLKPANSAFFPQPIDSATVDTTIYPGPNRVPLGAKFAAAINAFATRTNVMPDEFFINGYAIVNPPPYAVGTVTRNDEVQGTNTVTMPFDLGILNAAYIDTTHKPMFDSATSARVANIDSALVHFDVTNGLPLNMTLVPQLIDTTTGAITSLDSILVPAAALNSDGSVTSVTPWPNLITLTGSQAQLFGRSYMRFIFRLFTPIDNTDGSKQPVPFTKSNSISLKVYANMVFRVDQNTFK